MISNLREELPALRTRMFIQSPIASNDYLLSNVGVLLATVGGTVVNGLTADLALKTGSFGNECSTDGVPMKMAVELRAILLRTCRAGLRRRTRELTAAGKAAEDASQNRANRDDQNDRDQQFKDGTKKHELAGARTTEA
jgi:hypothetical protein